MLVQKDWRGQKVIMKATYALILLAVGTAPASWLTGQDFNDE